jgi:excisionase family DNA binding protein
MLADLLPPDAFVGLTRPDLLRLAEETEQGPVHAQSRADCTVREVADYFGRSAQTVRDWIKSGKLQAYTVGREYRITPAALAEFEERLRNGRDAEPPDREAADLSAWRKS